MHTRGISKSPPKYLLHRKSRQAIVTLAGKNHYLGKFNSLESRREYDGVIAEWLQAGRPTRTIEAVAAKRLPIASLFLRHTKTFYGDSKEPENFKIALGPLKQL